MLSWLIKRKWIECYEKFKRHLLHRFFGDFVQAAAVRLRAVVVPIRARVAKASLRTIAAVESCSPLFFLAAAPIRALVASAISWFDFLFDFISWFDYLFDFVFEYDYLFDFVLWFDFLFECSLNSITNSIVVQQETWLIGWISRLRAIRLPTLTLAIYHNIIYIYHQQHSSFFVRLINCCFTIYILFLFV